MILEYTERQTFTILGKVPSKLPEEFLTAEPYVYDKKNKFESVNIIEVTVSDIEINKTEMTAYRTVRIEAKLKRRRYQADPVNDFIKSLHGTVDKQFIEGIDWLKWKDSDTEVW